MSNNSNEPFALTEEELSEISAHSSVAGHLAGLKQAIDFVATKAAAQFLVGNDSGADLLRELKVQLEKLAEKYSKELAVYIKKSYARNRK